MGGIDFAACRRKIEANSTLIDTLERGIKKATVSMNSRPFDGVFMKQNKEIYRSEIQKIVGITHFFKKSYKNIRTKMKTVLSGGLLFLLRDCRKMRFL